MCKAHTLYGNFYKCFPMRIIGSVMVDCLWVYAAQEPHFYLKNKNLNIENERKCQRKICILEIFQWHTGESRGNLGFRYRTTHWWVVGSKYYSLPHVKTKSLLQKLKYSFGTVRQQGKGIIVSSTDSVMPIIAHL